MPCPKPCEADCLGLLAENSYRLQAAPHSANQSWREALCSSDPGWPEAFCALRMQGTTVDPRVLVKRKWRIDGRINHKMQPHIECSKGSNKKALRRGRDMNCINGNLGQPVPCNGTESSRRALGAQEPDPRWVMQQGDKRNSQTRLEKSLPVYEERKHPRKQPPKIDP